MKTLLKTTLLSAAILALTANVSVAGDYPDRPIGVAVSYGAGGGDGFSGSNRDHGRWQ